MDNVSFDAFIICRAQDGGFTVHVPGDEYRMSSSRCVFASTNVNDALKYIKDHISISAQPQQGETP